MPMPPQGKSILMTPDPYHVPGYGGFCPQFKFQIGETFGRTTSRLLQDPCVASSRKLVLSQMYTGGKNSEEDEKLLKKRARSWGNQKYVDSMVPGYTGFIPKSQHYFGKRYAQNCVNAITDFEVDQDVYKVKIKELSFGDRNDNDAEPGVKNGKSKKSSNQTVTPLMKKTILKPIVREPKPYISPNAATHSMSPYYMNNENPKKSYMSGYTGFVPRALGKIGRSYPLITHSALNEFTDDLKVKKNIQTAPVLIQRNEKYILDASKIYPVESGVVPHYTGHIPGQKFRYGNTFGSSTQNAMQRAETVA